MQNLLLRICPQNAEILIPQNNMKILIRKNKFRKMQLLFDC